TSLKAAAAQGTATTTAAAARAATAPAPAKANATSSPLSNPLLKTAGTLISAGGQAVRQIKARTQPDFPQQLRSANQRALGLTGADTTSADQPQSQMKSNELIIGVFSTARATTWKTTASLRIVTLPMWLACLICIGLVRGRWPNSISTASAPLMVNGTGPSSGMAMACRSLSPRLPG